MKILFVHGRAQQGKSDVKIGKEWLEALNSGLAKNTLPAISAKDVSVPFYGDALDQLAKQTATPRAHPDLSQRSFESYDQFQRDYAIEVAEFLASELPVDLRQGGKSPGRDRSNAQHRDRGTRAAADDDILERGPQNWWWVIEVIRAVDRRFTGVSTFSIEKMLRDVYLYITNAEARRIVDEFVETKLADNPDIVIAHSLGSVVAYNVLCNHKGKVPLLVTVGSPLAIRAIASRLPEPKCVPKKVGTWINAYDRRDVVALNPLRAPDFKTKRKIIDHPDVDNFTENRHGIAGYLSDAFVAGHIGKLIEGRQ